MIYTIHHRAKEFFASIHPNGDGCFGIKEDSLRMIFMDQIFDLLEYIPELGDLVFSEKEPKQSAEIWNDEVNGFAPVTYGGELLKDARKAWQQRRDIFEPIFTNCTVEDGQVKFDSGLIYDLEPPFGDDKHPIFQVKDIVRLGGKLNPESPKIKSIQYFKEVINHDKD